MQTPENETTAPRRRGPWPWILGGMLLLHATGMAFAVRAALSDGGAREIRPAESRTLEPGEPGSEGSGAKGPASATDR